MKPHVTKVFKERLKRSKKQLLTYDLLLAVEYNPKEDQYILVGGYDRYLFLSLNGYNEVPCIIEAFTSPTIQKLKILRRFQNKGDAWAAENKVEAFKMLERCSNKIITIHTGFDKSDIENYTKEKVIRNKKETKVTIKVMNKCLKNLSLRKEVKEFLVKRISEEEDTSPLLTIDRLEFIIIVLKKVKGFNSLEAKQQIKVLKRCISFYGQTLNNVQEMINEFLRPG